MSHWQTSVMLHRLRDQQDRAAWDGFFARFHRPLRSFARRFGLGQDELDDLVQDTLLAFAEAFRAGRYDPAKGRLRAWFFGIAYHQLQQRIRAEARQDKRQPAGHARTAFWAAIPDRAEAERNWDADWEAAALAACMRQIKRELTDSSLEAFDLVVRKGVSADVAARQLGISRNAVYVAKHRVLKRLQELMQQYEQVEPD